MWRKFLRFCFFRYICFRKLRGSVFQCGIFRVRFRSGIFRFFREVKAGLKGAFPELFG